MVEKVDFRLKSKDEADEDFLGQIIEDYRSIKKKVTSVPKENYGESMSKLAGAIDDRINSCLISLALFYEKTADTAYNEYRFNDSLKMYNAAIMILGAAPGATRDKAVKRFNLKVAATYRTGKSFVDNKVKSYIDRTEYLNIKEEISNAKSTLKDARSFLTGGMSVFVTEQALDTYNGMAGMLSVKLLKRSDIDRTVPVYKPADKFRPDDNYATSSIKEKKTPDKTIKEDKTPDKKSGQSDPFTYYMLGLIPGAGQFYAGDYIKGAIFGAAFAGSAAWAILASMQYAKSKEKYDNMTFGSEADFDSAFSKAESDGKMAKISIIGVAAVYTLNVLDILFLSAPENCKFVGTIKYDDVYIGFDLVPEQLPFNDTFIYTGGINAGVRATLRF